MRPKNAIKIGLFCVIYTTVIGMDISRQNKPRNGRNFATAKTDKSNKNVTGDAPCWARSWPGVASKNNFF